METYITIQSILGLAFGIAFLIAGALVLKNRESKEYKRPIAMFSLWWIGIGSAWLVWAIDTLLVSNITNGNNTLAMLDYSLILLYFMVILLSFAALFYYLLFLYFGKEKYCALTFILYGAFTGVLLIIFGLSNNPATFQATGIQDAVFGSYQSIADVLRIVLIVPVIIGSASLFFLYRKLEESTQKYRLTLLASSLLFYLIMPLIFPSNPGIIPKTSTEWISEILNKIGAIVAITALYMAYYPPTALKIKYGFKSLGREKNE